MQTALAVSLTQLATPPFDLGVIDFFILPKAAWKDVADGCVNGQLEDRELFKDLVQPHHIVTMGDRAMVGQWFPALREFTDVLGVVEGLDMLARAGNRDSVEKLEKVEIERLENRRSVSFIRGQ